MLLVLFLAAGSACVPMRWLSGDPKSLDLVAGSAVNCLLLEKEC